MHLNLTGGSGFLLTTKYGYYPSRLRQSFRQSQSQSLRRNSASRRAVRACVARASASSRLFSKSLSVLPTAVAAAATAAPGRQAGPRDQISNRASGRRAAVRGMSGVVDFLVRFHKRNSSGCAEIEAQKLTVQEDLQNVEG